MNLKNITMSLRRKPGDPVVIRKGPSGLPAADRIARGLGWFSLGLGLIELIAPRQIAEPLGMQHATPLIRSYGAREIATGIGALSLNPGPAMWGRVGGDAIDLATLAVGFRNAGQRNRRLLGFAIAAVAGFAVLDLVTARMLHQRHARRGPTRDYSSRSGFPRAAEQMRGAARELAQPRQFPPGQRPRGSEPSIRPHG